MKRFRQFLALSPPCRRLFIEAVLALAAARLFIVMLPFRRYVSRLGRHRCETPLAPLDEVRADEARRVGWAIALACRHTPWNSACLPQAMAGRWMLQRRGISCTLYLGVAKGTDGMAAHAWLRAGDVIVTGRGGMRRFTVVSSFA